MKMTILLSVASLIATGVVTNEADRPVSDAAGTAAPESNPSLLCTGRLETAVAEAEADLPVGTMRLSKKVLYRGDVLELRFTTPHGSRLAIKDPDGKFFYVVFPAADATSKLVPLVDSGRFVRLSTLRIETDRLKADPYTYGVEENQRVFTQSGTYTLIMGHNLHVDDETELVIEKIKYHHQKNPAAAKNHDIAAN